MKSVSKQKNKKLTKKELFFKKLREKALLLIRKKLKKKLRKQSFDIKKKYQLKFLTLMGGPAEYTNMQFVSRIFFSKNNIEIFSWKVYKMRFLTIFAAFRWLIGNKLRSTFYLESRIMFASTTPVYAGLMRWAAISLNGLHSSNRWWSGSITANVKYDYLPHYLFIPDMNDNLMIVQEAVKKRIAIIAVNSSDSLCLADIPLFGNDKEFRNIVQAVNFLITCSNFFKKLKPVSVQQNLTYSNFFKTKW